MAITSRRIVKLGLVNFMPQSYAMGEARDQTQVFVGWAPPTIFDPD